MVFDLVWGLAAVAGGLLILALVGVLWLAVVLAWGERRTRRLGYFGLPPADRERFRRRLAFHRRMLAPLLDGLGRTSGFSFEKSSFRFGGISAPRGTCTPESFRAGVEHLAVGTEIYVVTQMRSGTTWMQHLLYEVLMRGRGDLVERGRTLYAVSPWLESEIGVAVDDAPAIGVEGARRIVKTHLPVELCPSSRAARYVYVARHPASCFASCVDFLAENLGPMTPAMDAVEAWFCSDESMWWGSWPRHVDGWWRRAAETENVLFVRFEEMVADLPGVIRRVADFLGLRPLEEHESARVAEKAGFAYMKRHKATFEMYPPHLLAVDSRYFRSGAADRHRDVPDAVRERVMSWCTQQVGASGFPIGEFYPFERHTAGSGEPTGGVDAPRGSEPRTAGQELVR